MRSVYLCCSTGSCPQPARFSSADSSRIIAAVKGMLSTIPKPIADAQRIPGSSAVRSPSVRPAMAAATSSIAPVSSRADHHE
jgi:hypothetical protein